MKLLFSLFLLCASFGAGAVELKCNNCTLAQYKQKASDAGVGDHYVYDLSQGNVNRYIVERSCEEGRRCIKEVWQAAVHPDVKKVVTELSAYYVVTAGQMSSWFTVYADGSIRNLSAFDVAGAGGPQTQMVNWFNSSKSATVRNALPMAGAAIHSLIATAVNIFKNNIGTTHIKIVFTDGSEVTVGFEPINSTVEILEGSAKDKFGNVIITKADQASGLRFDYSREPGGPAEQRMKGHLSFYGIKVSTSTKWGCTSAGDHVVCKPY